jgi:hypothetical protein
MHAHRLADEIVDIAKREKDAYEADAPDERPLGGYAALLATYSAAVAAGSLVARWRGKRPPAHWSIGDMALVGIATHKVSRIITKDAVTGVVRAPFTEFDAPSGPGEVHEEVRGTGVRHAVGELLTCPFCIAQWVATAFTFGMVLAPRATRAAAAVFVGTTISDSLQFAYAALQKTEG